MGCGASAPPVELTGGETAEELRDLVCRGSVEAAVVCLNRGDVCDLSMGKPSERPSGRKPLGVKGADALGAALQRPECKAKKLVLEGCYLNGGAGGGRGVGSSRSGGQPGLIGGAGLKKFVAGLAANTSIEHLDLTQNGLGDYSVERLAEALETNRTLKTLILSDNLLGCEGNGLGARALGKALRPGGNDVLRELHLNSNGFLNSSATTDLAKALAKNTSLKVLRYETDDMFDPSPGFTRVMSRYIACQTDKHNGIDLIPVQGDYLGSRAMLALAEKTRPDMDVTFSWSDWTGSLPMRRSFQQRQYVGGKCVRTLDHRGDSGPPAVVAAPIAPDK